MTLVIFYALGVVVGFIAGCESTIKWYRGGLHRPPASVVARAWWHARPDSVRLRRKAAT